MHAPTGSPFEFELEYLAQLTRAGLKPLSRWEGAFDVSTARALEARGLKTRVVQRLLAAGGTSQELLFSNHRAALDAYARRFDGRPLDHDRASVRAEGRWFGYPSCCVESYVARGYARNGLDPADQRLLFHWTCPHCVLTPLLLPHYRRIHEQCRVASVSGTSPTGSPSRRTGAKAAVHRLLVQATSLAALGAISVAVPGSATELDAHRLSLDPASDPDKDLLTTGEEAVLGLDPNRADEDANGTADGVDLALALSKAIDQAPTGEQRDRVFVLHSPAFGLEQCEICGEPVNMGFFQVVNPLENQSVSLPYVAKHFLEHGSFSYRGSVHAGRVAPPLLRTVLTGQVNPHWLVVEPDHDRDYLTDGEERGLGKSPENPDEDGNRVADGIDLARALTDEIAALPTKPTETAPYRLDFALRGLERCDVCGQTVNMGHLTVVNPQAQLEVTLPYIGLHGLEHGTFSFAGDVHGHGRSDAELLAEALHAKGPGHRRAVPNDADGDGLADAEEKHFRSDPAQPDTNVNGVTDGAELARALAAEVQALSRSPNPRVYGVDHLLRGLVQCDRCGRSFNMGYVEIVNPRENVNLEVSYLALHAMHYGSFGYTEQGRVDPRRLDTALHGDGTSHLVRVAEDADADGLLDAEEPRLGTSPTLADTDGDGLLDGVELAWDLARRIADLPRTRQAAATFALHAEADCYAPCPVCAEPINCGHVEVVNPWADLSMVVRYLDLHFMERGSFAVNADERVDPVRLEAILRPGVLIAAGKEGVTLRWFGKGGRQFQVWSAADLTGPWQAGPVMVGRDQDLEFVTPANRRGEFFRVSAW